MANNTEVKRGVVIYLDGHEVENSAKSIRLEMNKVKKEIDGCTLGSKEYVAATKRYRELNGILQEHKKNLGTVSDATSEATRMGQSYANQITSMLGLNGKFGSSLMSLTSGGNIFSNLSSAVSGFGSTLTGLLANPAFLSIAGLAGVGAAFKFWYDYNKGIAEATRLTREFLGISGDDLVPIRSEIQAIADTFGKDYKSVLQTVDSLMSQYGIDAQSALSVVRDGFIAGADANGTFLQQLSQYAPAFNDIGIGAQELTALISQTRSGIFSEQGMDAIAMAGKKIREMGAGVQGALETLNINPEEITAGLQEGSITTFDVIQRISTEMRKLNPQSQEVGEVLKEVFGKQGSAAGYQLVAAFSEVSTSIEECKSQTGEYGTAMEEYTQAQAELNTATAALFDFTQQGFEEMGIQLKTIGTNYLTEIVKGTIKLVNWFAELYNSSTVLRISVALLKDSFIYLWMGVNNGFTLIKTSYSYLANAFDTLITAMMALYELDFEKAAKTLKEGLTNSLDLYVNQMTELYDNTASSLTGMFDNLKNSLTDKLEGVTIPVTLEPQYNEPPQTVIPGTGGNGNGNGNGNGDKTKGKSAKTVKEPTEADRIKAETAVINTEILKKQALLKQSYLKGEIDKRKYNDDMEALEMERLTRTLNIAGLEPQKVEELQNKVLDAKMKIREKLDQQNETPLYHDDNDDSAEAKAEAELKKLQEQYNERQAILDSAVSSQLISEEDYERQSAALFDDFVHAAADITQKFKDETDKLKEAGVSIEELAYSIGESIGVALADSVTNNMDGVKNALKSLLNIIIDAIEKMVIAAEVESTLLTLTGLGTAAGVANLAKLVGIKVAFAALKEGVNSFAIGGYTGIGGAYEPAGIVHKGEFVANRHALSNPAVRAVLDLIDNAQKSGTIANLSSSDISAAGQNSYAPQQQASSRSDAELLAVLKATATTLQQVNDRFSKPIKARTYVLGDGGIDEAIERASELQSNAKRIR